MNSVTLVVGLVSLVALICYSCALLAERSRTRLLCMVIGLSLTFLNVVFFSALRDVKAQDVVTTLFTYSCEVTTEGQAVVLVTSDGEEHYTLDNQEGIDTSIPAEFVTEVGTHVLGYVDSTHDYHMSLVRDDGLFADLSMTADWQVWCDKDNLPPEEPIPTEEPTETPVYEAPAVVSTNRTCVVGYLPNNQVTLNCSG